MDYTNLSSTPSVWLDLGDGNQTSSNSSGLLEYSGNYFTWPTWLTVLTCATLPASVLLNMWVLVHGFGQTRIRQSPFHLLLMNQCFTSLLLCCLAYPVIVHKMNIGGFSENNLQVYVCKVAIYCLLWFVSVALCNHSLVAANRALSCFPHYAISRKMRHFKGTCYSVIVIWVTSLIMYMVPAAHYRIGWPASFNCYEVLDFISTKNSEEKDTVRMIIKHECLLTVLSSLVVSLVSYSLIIWYLFGCSNAAVRDSQKRRKEKLRALCVIATVFSVFLLCWLPVMYIMQWQVQVIAELPIIFYLPMLENALNPVLYMVTIPAFRPPCFVSSRIGAEQRSMHQVDTTRKSISSE